MNDNQDYWCGVSPVLTFFDYFTEPQMAREVYQEVFAKGSVADSPLTLRHKEGKHRCSLTDPFIKMIKECLGIVIVARDITDKKEVKQN
jgi:hypothetical protein